MLAALSRARDRVLYRLLLSDIPDPTSAVLGGRAASPTGAGAACGHGQANHDGRRDAALGLALCAYLVYTTSFIVNFHLEQAQHEGAIADNKRVYVVARRALRSKRPL